MRPYYDSCDLTYFLSTLPDLCVRALYMGHYRLVHFSSFMDFKMSTNFLCNIFSSIYKTFLEQLQQEPLIRPLLFF